MTEKNQPNPGPYPSENRSWFVVVHEFPMENSRGDRRTDYGIASGVHDRMETADNQLAYCQMLQQSEHPGSKGRYFIARMIEEPPSGSATAPPEPVQQSGDHQDAPDTEKTGEAL